MTNIRFKKHCFTVSVATLMQDSSMQKWTAATIAEARAGMQQTSAHAVLSYILILWLS